MLTKHCRCFSGDTKGADGPADLLGALSQSSLLEELNFSHCCEIPAAAWQKVRSAKWLNLKKADFTECLAERNGQTKAKVFLFFVQRLFVSVGCCPSSDLYGFVKLLYELELTWMGYCCYCIPACTYRCLNDLFDRSMLTKHCRCFVKGTQGADGAADLLQALSHSTQLEELNFLYCNQIPALAWQNLPDGAWPKLAEARGIPKEELQRLQLGAEGATCRTVSTSTLEIAADDSVALAGPRRLKTAVARDLDSDAMELMARLSSLPIEVLDFSYCPQIPTAAWQKWHGANWPNLKKADFSECLVKRNGAQVFLFPPAVYVSLLEVVHVQVCLDLWSCRMSRSWPRWV